MATLDSSSEAPTSSSKNKDLFKFLHTLFHSNSQSLTLFLQSFFSLTPSDKAMLQNIASNCQICQRTNPHTPLRPKPFPSHQARGHIPAADWQVDFTNMPTVRRTKYLLVFVDTFSGWVEAFPTSNKKASTVASILLTDIIPRFGMPTSLQSDNGPEFISRITQKVSQALSFKWHFHCPYRPQASGKVERVNRTLKEVLTKLTMELNLDWVKLLPLALLRIRALPKKPSLLSPFEIMYGRPLIPPGLVVSQGPLTRDLSLPLLFHLRSELWKYQDWLLPDPVSSPNTPPLTPGSLVYYNTPEEKGPLAPKWEGPYPVILCTPTAAKLSLPDNRLTPWIHISRLKPYHQEAPPADDRTTPEELQESPPEPPLYSCSPHPSHPFKLRLTRCSPQPNSS